MRLGDRLYLQQQKLKKKNFKSPRQVDDENEQLDVKSLDDVDPYERQDFVTARDTYSDDRDYNPKKWVDLGVRSKTPSTSHGTGLREVDTSEGKVKLPKKAIVDLTKNIDVDAKVPQKKPQLAQREEVAPQREPEPERLRDIIESTTNALTADTVANKPVEESNKWYNNNLLHLLLMQAGGAMIGNMVEGAEGASGGSKGGQYAIDEEIKRIDKREDFGYKSDLANRERVSKNRDALNLAKFKAANQLEMQEKKFDYGEESQARKFAYGEKMGARAEFGKGLMTMKKGKETKLATPRQAAQLSEDKWKEVEGAKASTGGFGKGGVWVEKDGEQRYVSKPMAATLSKQNWKKAANVTGTITLEKDGKELLVEKSKVNPYFKKGWRTAKIINFETPTGEKTSGLSSGAAARQKTGSNYTWYNPETKKEEEILTVNKKTGKKEPTEVTIASEAVAEKGYKRLMNHPSYKRSLLKEDDLSDAFDAVNAIQKNPNENANFIAFHTSVNKLIRASGDVRINEEDRRVFSSPLSLVDSASAFVKKFKDGRVDIPVADMKEFMNILIKSHKRKQYETVAKVAGGLGGRGKGSLPRDVLRKLLNPQVETDTEYFDRYTFKTTYGDVKEITIKETGKKVKAKMNKDTGNWEEVDE